MTSKRRFATGLVQSPSMQVTFGRFAWRTFSAAIASASALKSVAVTSHSARSAAIATAIAPLPVPKSRICHTASLGISRKARSTTSSVSGRGTSVAGLTSVTRARGATGRGQSGQTGPRGGQEIAS